MTSKIIIALTLIALSTPIAWNDINTGKITPITSFSGNYGASNYTYTFSNGLANSTVTVCLGLISYESYLSTTFTFNTTVVTVNSSSIALQIQTNSTTYFSVLSYHYLISSHSTLQLERLCYYTSSLFVGTGDRSQSFTNIATAFNGSFVTSLTAITGMKITNTNGTYLQIKTASSIFNNGTVNITISTSQNNLLEWVCLSLVIYNPKTTVVGEFYLKETALISYSAGLVNCIAGDSSFLIANTMFFGLSSLKMSLILQTTQQFIMNTDRTADPLDSPLINQNQLQLSLEQLFMWTDNCITNSSNMVPMSGYNCTVGCDQLFYNTTNQYCLVCPFTTGNCLTCDATQCLSCNNATFRQLNTSVSPKICECIAGFFQLNGNCTNCSDSIVGCLSCQNQTYCISCQQGFTPYNGECVCDTGTYLVNSTCSPLKGCTTYNNITTGYYCLVCDTDHSFQLVDNQTCSCISNTNFNVRTGYCEGTCSDGISYGNQCDLGANNGVPGSGCAANCTVVDGYYCTNPNTSTVSVCVSMANYTGEYLYSTKKLTSNTVNTYVQLSPNDQILSSMDFSSLVNSSISSDSIKCSFDSSTGILEIVIQYTQDIEGDTHDIRIYFNQSIIKAEPVIITTQIHAVNAKLAYSQFEQYNVIIQYLAMFIGGIILVFAIVTGAIGYKMVGFEICLPLQVLAMTLICLEMPYSAVSSLFGLQLSSGYNRLQSYDLSQYLDWQKGMIVIQRNYSFLQNCNYIYILLLLLLVISAILRIGVPQKQEQVKKKPTQIKKQEKMVEQNDNRLAEASQPGKVQKAYYFVVDRFLVNVWVLLLLYTTFCFMLQLQEQKQSSKFSHNFNIILGTFIMLTQLFGMIFIIYKLNDKSKTVTFRTHSKYYPIIYITLQVTSIIIIISSYYSTKYTLYFPLIIQIVIIIVYIKFRPYGKFLTFNSIVGFIIQFFTPICTALLGLAEVMKTSMFAMATAFITITLFLIGFGLSIARLVLLYKKDKEKIQQQQIAEKVKNEESNLEALTYNSIKNKLIANNPTERRLNWDACEEQKDLQSQNKVSKEEKLKQEVESEEASEASQEEDQLRKLKMKLRKELFSKRGYQE